MEEKKKFLLMNKKFKAKLYKNAFNAMSEIINTKTSAL